MLGILLSRVVSGLLADPLGWRLVFLVSAAGMALMAVVLWRALPNFPRGPAVPYGALLASLASLWRQHPGLRQAAWAQAGLSVGFSAFWSTLAVLLQGAPFHLGTAAAGAFGLAGAAGALAAPTVGRLADRHGPAWVTRLGAGLALLSFASMALMPALPVAGQLGLLGLAAVGFDLGVQATLVAHQTLVHGLDPAARSRLNAVLFVAMFAGMATGAALGSLAFAAAGWQAVVALACVASGGALMVRIWGGPRQPQGGA